MKFNERGHEILDPTPVEMPMQWKRPPTLQEQIKAFVRRELSEQAAAAGAETFEEADDFDIEDDPLDPQSEWEMNYDQESAEHANPLQQTAPAVSPNGGDSAQGGSGISPVSGVQPGRPAGGTSTPAAESA